MKILNSHIHIFTIMSVVLISCNSGEAPDCLKRSGLEREIEIVLEPFHKIIVLDEMDIYLRNGPEQKVVLKAGENIIPDIHFEINEGILSITNKNYCNWLRNSGNPELYVTGSFIQEIETYDYVNIYTKDTLLTEKLRIYSDGTGDVNLKINADTLKIYSIFISNYQLKGNVKFFKVYMNNDGKINAKELISGISLIDHYGSNLIETFPLNRLSGKLMGTGDIYYYNTPGNIRMLIAGTGKLVDKSR